MGAQPYEKVWGPLLRGKFGDRADDISMAWLWGKLTMRRKLEGKEARQELLGYPRPLVGAAVPRAAGAHRGAGGRVLIDRPATRLAHRADGFEVTARRARLVPRGPRPARVRADGEPEPTTRSSPPSPTTSSTALLDDGLADAIGPEYLGGCTRSSTTPRCASCSSSTGSSAPSTGPTSPTPSCRSSASSSTPTSSSPSATTAGASSTSRTTSRPATSCSTSTRTRCSSATRPACARSTRASTAHGSSSAGCTASRPRSRSSPSAIRERIPPLQTGVPHLILANTTQIYPEDRGHQLRRAAGRRRRRGAALAPLEQRLVRDRVVAPVAPRVAAQQPPARQHEAAQHAVVAHGVRPRTPSTSAGTCSGAGTAARRSAGRSGSGRAGAARTALTPSRRRAAPTSSASAPRIPSVPSRSASSRASGRATTT